MAVRFRKRRVVTCIGRRQSKKERTEKQEVESLRHFRRQAEAFLLWLVHREIEIDQEAKGVLEELQRKHDQEIEKLEANVNDLTKQLDGVLEANGVLEELQKKHEEEIGELVANVDDLKRQLDGVLKANGVLEELKMKHERQVGRLVETVDTLKMQLDRPKSHSGVLVPNPAVEPQVTSLGRLPLIYVAQAGAFVVLSALLIFSDISDFYTIGPGTLIDAFYVTIATLLSIGFGDVAPLRLITQLFTDILALLGPILVAILAHFLLRFASEIEHIAFLSAVGSRTRRRVLAALTMILVTTVFGMSGIYVFEWDRLPDRSSPPSPSPSSSPSSCPSPSPPGLLPATSSVWELFVHIFHLSVMMMTTTGFGDYAFTTASGRLFATIWMPICTSVFAVASGFLAETFLIRLTHTRDYSLPRTTHHH